MIVNLPGVFDRWFRKTSLVAGSWEPGWLSPQQEQLRLAYIVGRRRKNGNGYTVELEIDSTSVLEELWKYCEDCLEDNEPPDRNAAQVQGTRRLMDRIGGMIEDG